MRLRILVGLLCSVLAASAIAGDGCRVAFDMGSSGIRAGASNSSVMASANIDYLTPQWAGRGLEETLAPTIAALDDLPAKGGFGADCERVGGGFSAWRMALQASGNELAALLERLRAATGVSVLVIPQSQEGAYGYLGARQALGNGLETSHVLDIGGGSLQIAGEHSSFGDLLGQKVWHRYLCQEIRNSESAPCRLQPMTGDELAAARALLAEKLKDVGGALQGPVSMTAISRPVSRGVLPAVLKLSGENEGRKQFGRAELTIAIERLARMTMAETAAHLGGSSAHMAWLLSDMLLVEGLLQATGADTLTVAEIDLTNIPGLLADERAFAWQRHYGCYLDRLRGMGLDAYASDSASCP